jgi:hypothetical protein
MQSICMFGVWDAPITDGARHIEVPLTRQCMHCRAHFVPGDNGAVYSTGMAVHRECAFRAVIGGIGHQIDHQRYCQSDLGPDAGLTYRQSAWLVWRHLVDKYEVTATELDTLRKIQEKYG